MKETNLKPHLDISKPKNNFRLINKRNINHKMNQPCIKKNTKQTTNHKKENIQPDVKKYTIRTRKQNKEKSKNERGKDKKKNKHNQRQTRTRNKTKPIYTYIPITLTHRINSINVSAERGAQNVSRRSLTGYQPSKKRAMSVSRNKRLSGGEK